VTATHISEPGAAEAVRHAFSIARREGLLILVDLDYRARFGRFIPAACRDGAGRRWLGGARRRRRRK